MIGPRMTCTICGLNLRTDEVRFCRHCMDQSPEFIRIYEVWERSRRIEPECVHHYLLPMAAGRVHIQVCKKCGWCSWVRIFEGLPVFHGLLPPRWRRE